MFTLVKRLLLFIGVVVSLSLITTGCHKDPPVDPTPQITSFTPVTAKGGASIVLTGVMFSTTAGNNIVTINGKPATVTAVNADGNQLTVTVPAKAGSGPITVTVDGRKGTSVTNFTYEWLYAVTTLAGDGQPGSTDSPNGALARFNYPYAITVDVNGNVFVGDIGNQKIRKITPDGSVSTIAGNGTIGFKDDANGANAQFADPYDLVVDANGNLYVADLGNNRIRKVGPTGAVSTIAGSGVSGWADAPNGANAQFAYPAGIAMDGNGNLYIADMANNKIRKVAPSGAVTTLAGSTFGYKDDPVGSNAQFWDPYGVAVDSTGNILVTERHNRRIRKISPGGAVITLAGNGSGAVQDNSNGLMASFTSPGDIAIDNIGDFYVLDGSGGANGSRIRKVAPGGATTTFAGGNSGFANHDSNPLAAQFNNSRSIAIDKDGNIYIADADNHRIRKIIPR